METLSESSSEGEGEATKVTRPKANNDCNCNEECVANRCTCVKAKRGCDSTCKCKCKNILKHMEFFFGPNETCEINPCFEQWLTEMVRNCVESFDRNALRDRIINCSM